MDLIFLFATETTGGEGGTSWWFTAGGVTALIASIVGNVILLWREARRARKDGQEADKRHRRDTVEEYEVLLRKSERSSARHETQILALQRSAAILAERCAECDSDMERVFGFMRLLHGAAIRMSEDIVALGGKAEEIPPLPRMPKKRYPEAEFMDRTVSQFNRAGRAADAGDSVNTDAIQPQSPIPSSAPPMKEPAGEDPDG